MKPYFTFLSVLLCLSLLAPSPLQAGEKPQTAELIALRNRAKQILRECPQKEFYIRRLLTLTAGTAVLAALAEVSAQNAARAVAAVRAGHPEASRGTLPRETFSGRFLFAKRRTPELTGNLFDQPAQTPSKPAPKRDLSWLDEPGKPVAPRPKELSLFDMPEAEIKPKTFLSKRIMENYRPRLSRLPLSEQQGLIEALDEAVLRKKTSGRQMAIKFLEQKAAQSATTSLYFIIAKRMLLISGILLAADLYMQSSPEETMMRRLAENPVLFLDASDEQLRRLARHPQAGSYCRRIVRAVQMLAQTAVSDEELLLRPLRQNTGNALLRAAPAAR